MPIKDYDSYEEGYRAGRDEREKEISGEANFISWYLGSHEEEEGRMYSEFLDAEDSMEEKLRKSRDRILKLKEMSGRLSDPIEQPKVIIEQLIKSMVTMRDQISVLTEKVVNYLKINTR